MNKKLVYILIFIFLGNISCNALQTNMPLNKIATQEIQIEKPENESFLNLFFSFIGGIFKRITGESSNPLVKSEDLSKLSNEIKFQQSKEEQTNPEYKNSHTKDKVDFGTGILDLIAGILKFFE
jgi:hypothetical protein